MLIHGLISKRAGLLWRRAPSCAISVCAPRLLPPTAHLQSYTPIGHVDAVDADAVLQANAGLLAAISNMDWESYEAFCADDISCFEAEAGAQQVVGKPFHKYYFDLAAKNKELGATTPPLPNVSTMMSPKVRISGDIAVVTYARAMQTSFEGGAAGTGFSAETRVWQRQQGDATRWLNVVSRLLLVAYLP